MDIGGGSSFRGGEVSTTTPPVCEDNQSESRTGTGSRSRWRSGVSPPGEFDPLTVPLPVENDSNNSSNSSEEENKDPNDDGDGDVNLKVNEEDKIRCVIVDVEQRPSPIHPSIIEPHVYGHVMLHTHLTQRQCNYSSRICSGAQGHSGTDLSLALFIELLYPQCTLFCCSELLLRAVCWPSSFSSVQVDLAVVVMRSGVGGETCVPYLHPLQHLHPL